MLKKSDSREEKKIQSSKIIKDSKFEIDKKKEAMSSIAMVLAAGALGYFLFVQEPLAAKNAYATDYRPDAATSTQEDRLDSGVNTKKEKYEELEVAEAVNNFISSDPNVRISSESFEEDVDDLGILLLVVDHHGLAGELSQYIETLNSAPKSIVVDNINYTQTLDGSIDTEISLSIPYKKVDGSLASKSFVTEDSTELAEATNSNSSSASSTTSKWTKPTPATKSSITSKSSGSGSSSNSRAASASKGKSSSKSYTKPKSSGSTSSSHSTAKPKPPKVTVTDQDDPKIGQGQEVQTPSTNNGQSPTTEAAFTTPVLTPDTEHFAPAYVNYSTVENIVGIESEFSDVIINREDIKSTDVKDESIKLNIKSQFTPDQTADLQRLVTIKLKPFYLPKNAQTISFDLNSYEKLTGEFMLIIEDGSGHEIKLENQKIETVDPSQTKLVFKLDNMDGKFKVKSLEYEFETKENLNEEVNIKNIEISSIDQE